MRTVSCPKFVIMCLFTIFLCLSAGPRPSAAAENDAKKGAGGRKGPPPVPVRVASVEKRTVSDQISLIGTTEAIAISTIAAEFSGVVEAFSVKAGDFVKKGQLLASLKNEEMRLRLKSYMAERERVRANLDNAEKDLKRLKKLHEANSISETKYDVALYARLALSKAFLKSQAEIEMGEYQIANKKVFAPFSGFVTEEHTQVGEWIKSGGPVVTLMDMAQVLITVDVPERFAVKISPSSPVRVLIKNVSATRLSGDIYAMLFQGNAVARTLPVQVRVENPDFKIRAGMEAQVTFNLAGTREAVLIPKDAVVTAGNNRMVYAVIDGKAVPVGIDILGYYAGDVAVSGNLTPGMVVVTRGNERLRPGQAVAIVE